MEFKKLSLDDIDKISPFFKDVTHRACDCTLGGVFIWRDYFESYYLIEDDTLLCAFGTENKTYTYPIGKNIEEALDKIERDAKENGRTPTFYLCSEQDMTAFKLRYPDAKIEEMRDAFDYLYSYEDLATFKGRRYSGQRNHINKFKRLYESYSFEELTPDNCNDCRELLESFLASRERTEATDAEGEKIHEIFDNLDKYKSLGFFGGVLYVNGKAVGFSIAEVIGDTMFVHIEKADVAYEGAYQMLVCSFADHYRREGVEYINREDDAGNEGLRKSKLAYQPIALLPKYRATI